MRTKLFETFKESLALFSTSPKPSSDQELRHCVAVGNAFRLEHRSTSTRCSLPSSMGQKDRHSSEERLKGVADSRLLDKQI